MLYPTISDYVNQRNQSRAVANYAQDVDNMTDADYSAYFDAADAFNAQVAANENALFRPDQLSGYNETLDITGTGIMGYITISKIGVELPIYHAPATACCRSPQATWRAPACRWAARPPTRSSRRTAACPAQSCLPTSTSWKWVIPLHHRAGPGAHLRGGQNLHRAAHRDR